MNKHSLSGCITTLNFVWFYYSATIFSANAIYILWWDIIHRDVRAYVDILASASICVRRNTVRVRVCSCPTTGVQGCQWTVDVQSDQQQQCQQCALFCHGLKSLSTKERIMLKFIQIMPIERLVDSKIKIKNQRSLSTRTMRNLWP